MELMKELSLAPGVSGSEEEIAKIITRELKDVADKIETDSMGNLIATKKGKKKGTFSNVGSAHGWNRFDGQIHWW